MNAVFRSLPIQFASIEEKQWLIVSMLFEQMGQRLVEDVEKYANGRGVSD